MKFLFLLVLSALALQSSAFLNLNPSTKLQLPSDLSDGKVSISLKARPISKVTVYFDGPKTRFDRCALEFTPTNWNIPQNITAVSESFSTVSTAHRNIPITFQAWSDDCNFHNQGHTMTIDTVRGPGKEGRCTITGDPHYTPFETPITYHYMGVGTYYLIQSDTLTVQARQERCFKRATCIVAIAVRYGGAVFIVDGTRKDISNYVQAITHTNGVTISRTRNCWTNTVNLAFNSGSNIKLDFVTGWSLYTNVYLNLGTYLQGRVKGLCGTYDNNPNNDFTTSNGTVYSRDQIYKSCYPDTFNQARTFPQTPLNAFGNSWLVPDSDNIFKGVRTANKLPLDVTIMRCVRPAPSSIKCTTIGAQFVEPSLCLTTWKSSWAYSGTRRRRAVIPNGPGCNDTDILPPPLAVANVPSGFQIQQIIPTFDGKPPAVPKLSDVLMPDASDEVIEKAANLCQIKIAKIKGCPDEAAWVSSVENCMMDIRDRGNPTAMYEIHNIGYTETCAHQLLSMAEDPDVIVAESAKASVESLSFGSAECDPQCLQCIDRGCARCRDAVNYEIQVGKCVLKTITADDFPNGLFDPPPAQILLARSEVAPQISTSEALSQTNGNIVINPQAIIVQNINDGPVKLT